MAQTKEYTSANWTQEAMRRPTPSPYVQQLLGKIGIGYDGDSDTYTYPTLDSPGKAGAGSRGSSKGAKQKRSRKKAG